MICEKCSKEFTIDWRVDKSAKNTPCRFCSRACSNSKVQTKEINEKRSKTLTKKTIKQCSVCHGQINHKNKSGICIKCKDPKKSRYEHLKNHRIKRKEFLVSYKGGKCQICGYDKCIEALQFHHLDPKEKEFTISNTKKSKTREEDIKEVNKCVLLCCRCHAEVHYELRKGNDTILLRLDGVEPP